MGGGCSWSRCVPRLVRVQTTEAHPSHRVFKAFTERCFARRLCNFLYPGIARMSRVSRSTATCGRSGWRRWNLCKFQKSERVREERLAETWADLGYIVYAPQNPYRGDFPLFSFVLALVRRQDGALCAFFDASMQGLCWLWKLQRVDPPS